jgi:hypothetical protein
VLTVVPCDRSNRTGPNSCEDEAHGRAEARRWRGDPISRHARDRLRERGLGAAVIDAAIEHGRVVFTRGAVIYAIGRKEIEQARVWGVDLAGLDGVQVVVVQGLVVTVYRNRDLRGLLWRSRVRRGRRRRGRCSAAR